MTFSNSRWRFAAILEMFGNVWKLCNFWTDWVNLANISTLVKNDHVNAIGYLNVSDLIKFKIASWKFWECRKFWTDWDNLVKSFNVVENDHVNAIGYLNISDVFKFKMAPCRHLGNVWYAVTFEPLEIILVNFFTLLYKSDKQVESYDKLIHFLNTCWSHLTFDRTCFFSS